MADTRVKTLTLEKKSTQHSLVLIDLSALMHTLGRGGEKQLVFEEVKGNHPHAAKELSNAEEDLLFCTELDASDVKPSYSAIDPMELAFHDKFQTEERKTFPLHLSTHAPSSACFLYVTDSPQKDIYNGSMDVGSCTAEDLQPSDEITT
ncbi:hypothetical protein pdam_00024647 [Pocillopora damicornis]|uniref:Uncharacterized protein n=1 Tax=Pocillopora damicornis TaxID=46731 RepID=A0A3M6TQE0_POCDA|nr:hypothetical protein pdam_00024647 [Pocillopora damicornis]